MQDGFPIGYLIDGSELVLPADGRGLLLSGGRCARVARSIVWQLVGRKEKVLVLCLYEPLSRRIGGWLPDMDSEAVAGYVFTYDIDGDAYAHLLACSLSFGLDLDDDSEFMVRDAVKALASAAGAGGPVALLSMLPEQGGRQVEWARKRLEELAGTRYLTSSRIPGACLGRLWPIASANARAAVALAAASKFVMANGGGWVAFLGWNAITSMAVRSSALRGKLGQIMSEIEGLGGRVLALETDASLRDPRPGIFNVVIEERGPLFGIREPPSPHELTFAAPDLLVRPLPPPPEAPGTETAEVRRVLQLVKTYPNTTLAGLSSFLKGEMDDGELRLAIQEAFEKGYARMAPGPSTAKVVVLTEEGKGLLAPTDTPTEEA